MFILALQVMKINNFQYGKLHWPQSQQLRRLKIYVTFQIVSKSLLFP